ncbi:MAG: hypothetical protein HC831_00360 [Chloroflexia bacterium]|nr:hypothetical protein [Chloroflexia bacterium]
MLTICLSAQQTDQLLLETKGKNILTKEWSVSNGLISNSIGKIGKTKQGFLFICTFNGISFFDGKNFQNYNSTNVPALKTNIIADYCIDKDSTFWIATYRGIVAFKDNDFFVPDKLQELESTNIQSIDIDKNGTLWIGSVANGLFKYANGQLEKVKEIVSLEKSIVSLVYSDNEGNTWIGTESGLLYRYDGKKYTRIFHDRVENSISSAARDKKGNYYFGTRNGLFRYENDTIVKLAYEINFINDITVDDSDKLWLSTNSGIFIYDSNTKELTPFCPNEEWANQIIQTIYFDYDGNIWIGTYRKGVLQVRIGGFQNYPMNQHGISEVPSALIEVNDTTIWIGTDEGNIYSLTHSGYKKVKLKTNLNNSRIKSIFIDSKKNTWGL